jgi:polyhydroxyalkanoate synthesis regulator phasin
MSTIAQAQDLDAQFKAGNLSASEYKELLEDLRHTAAVNEAAGDLAKLTQIYEVLDDLKSAAGLI